MNMEIKVYKKPQAKVFEVNAQSVLCGSGDIKSMTIDEDGGNDFE